MTGATVHRVAVRPYIVNSAFVDRHGDCGFSLFVRSDGALRHPAPRWIGHFIYGHQRHHFENCIAHQLKDDLFRLILPS